MVLKDGTEDLDYVLQKSFLYDHLNKLRRKFENGINTKWFAH